MRRLVTNLAALTLVAAWMLPLSGDQAAQAATTCGVWRITGVGFFDQCNGHYPT